MFLLVCRRSSERGVVLPLLIIAMTAIFALFVLAIGITFVATEKTRLQLATNLVNLAALEEYIYTPPTGHSEAQRRQAALDKANAVAGMNSLATTQNPLGNIQSPGAPGSDGILKFGKYYSEQPNSGNPCTSYPCFDELPSGNGNEGNATYLDLRAQGNNAVTGFITSFLGKDVFDIGAKSVATLVEMCVAHALDVSDSTFAETHRKSYRECKNAYNLPAFITCPAVNPTPDPAPPAPPPHPYIGYPPPAGTPNPPLWSVTDPVERETVLDTAIQTTWLDSQGLDINDWPMPRASKVALNLLNIYELAGFGASCTGDITLSAGTITACLNARPCDIEATPGYSWGGEKNTDLYHWCNLYPIRADFENQTLLNTDNYPNLRFRSDYELQWVFYGTDGSISYPIPQFIYKYIQPQDNGTNEPWRSFMLAANVAIRTLNSLPSSGNQGMMFAFTGDIFNRVYPPATPNYQLTEDLEILSQFTNVDDHMGSVDKRGNPVGPRQHPGPVDLGFISFVPRQPDAADYLRWTNTNVLKALDIAAVALGADCGEKARKMINIYTDGLATCSYNNNGAGSFGENLTLFGAPEDTCDDSIYPTAWERYQRFEYAMLAGMQPWLEDRDIAVNVFLDGSGLRLNYRNLRNNAAVANNACATWEFPTPANKEEYIGCLHDFTSASIAGYGGPTAPTSLGSFGSCAPEIQSGQQTLPGSFFDCTSYDDSNSAVSHAVAFDAVSRGNIDFAFGRAAAVMGGLALRTGGELCMLFDVDPADVDDYVDHDLDYQPGGDCSGATRADCCLNIFNNVAEAKGKTPCRRKNSIRRTEPISTAALDFISPSAAAARCAAKAIRQNPFVLKPVDEMNCLTPGC